MVFLALFYKKNMIKTPEVISTSACTRKRSFEVVFTTPKRTRQCDRNHKKQFLWQWDNFCLHHVKIKGKFNHFNFKKHADLCLQVFDPLKSVKAKAKMGLVCDWILNAWGELAVISVTFAVNVKTDSAQRSSNMCKKYLPKNYS